MPLVPRRTESFLKGVGLLVPLQELLWVVGRAVLEEAPGLLCTSCSAHGTGDALGF